MAGDGDPDEPGQRIPIMRVVCYITLVVVVMGVRGSRADSWQSGFTAWLRGDYCEAVMQYRKAIEEGSIDALHSLGLAYKYGDCVPIDTIKAVEYFHAAARKGHVVSQFYFGLALQHGEGVPQAPHEASKWFRMAGASGYVPAQLVLGEMSLRGDGIPQNYSRAIIWYRMAAEKGDPDAQGMLGLMYSRGWGAPKDYVKAHMWTNLSAASDWKEGIVPNRHRFRDALAAQMTPDQLRQAQDLAVICQERQFRDCD